MGLKEENAKRAARRKFEVRELLQQLKRNPCVDCNKKFHPCQMDFYRLEESPKPISRNLLRSINGILKDIEKCDLVCANCARLRVWNKQRALRAGAV